MLDWRVPGYRMLRELRTGTVLARHEASGHPVLLRYHPPGPEAALATRRTEARSLADITSPHVAQLYEHIEVALPPHAEAAVGAVGRRRRVLATRLRYRDHERGHRDSGGTSGSPRASEHRELRPENGRGRPAAVEHGAPRADRDHAGIEAERVWSGAVAVKWDGRRIPAARVSAELVPAAS